LGLLSEMIVITALCAILGLGVGSVVSQPVANSMLSNQIELAENNQSSGGALVATPIGGNTNEQKPLSELEVNLNINAVIQIILISLALAGLSSIVGILYITKYEPMKILSERN